MVLDFEGCIYCIAESSTAVTAARVCAYSMQSKHDCIVLIDRAKAVKDQGHCSARPVNSKLHPTLPRVSLFGEFWAHLVYFGNKMVNIVSS